MSKLALGTAQFGMDYGINNCRGKISRAEAFEILCQAMDNGIDTVDTAAAYGESENVLGEFLGVKKKKFKVISKLPNRSLFDFKDVVSSSLKKLNISSFYGYLFHNFKTYRENPELLVLFKELKKEGKTKKIGFSLYYPHELEFILDYNLECDLVQVPYNVFDQRFGPYFQRLNDRKIEVHTRSVFMQGLIFKCAKDLDGYFSPVKTKIIELHDLAEKYRMPLVSMLVNFALANGSIDRVVVGVDGLDNFNEIMASASYLDRFSGVRDRLISMKEDDEQIILPFNWKSEAVR